MKNYNQDKEKGAGKTAPTPDDAINKLLNGIVGEKKDEEILEENASETQNEVEETSETDISNEVVPEELKNIENIPSEEENPSEHTEEEKKENSSNPNDPLLSQIFIDKSVQKPEQELSRNSENNVLCYFIASRNTKNGKFGCGETHYINEELAKKYVKDGVCVYTK